MEEIKAAVSIRTYNSRNLDTVVFLPESHRFLEENIKKFTSARLNRGRVEIRVSVENAASDSVSFRVDERRAESYIRALNELKDQCGIESDITLELLLSGRDMIVAEEKQQDQDRLEKVVSKALESALDRIEEMRKQEGNALEADLEHRLEWIEKRLARIEEEAETIPAAYKERLEERIAKLTGNAAGLDPARIAQEAAILADKSDISEELVRAKSHIQQARQIIASDEPGGRKLNFLVQEFNREFNTMGAKSPSAEISSSVVELKSELEKVREQVQNIE